MIIWYRTKVLRVLRDLFFYEPNLSGFQREAFNEATRQIRKFGGNEFDAAIAFMYVQLDNVPQTDDNFEWRFNLVNNAAYASKKATLPTTRDTALEIFEIYDKEATKKGLGSC